MQPEAEPGQPLAERERIFCNGLGGFTPDGHEYVITLEPGQSTPAPWVNVIASPYIGTVVSESGSAYTWVENAHEFRLTTWHNDPLSDSSGEAIYIRDEETGAFWSPTPLPALRANPAMCAGTALATACSSTTRPVSPRSCTPMSPWTRQ